MLTMLRSKYSNLTVQGVFDAVEAVMTTSVTGMLKRKIIFCQNTISVKKRNIENKDLIAETVTLTVLTMMMK